MEETSGTLGVTRKEMWGHNVRMGWGLLIFRSIRYDLGFHLGLNSDLY